MSSNKQHSSWGLMIDDHASGNFLDHLILGYHSS
jgi:hypothetical protein